MFVELELGTVPNYYCPPSQLRVRFSGRVSICQLLIISVCASHRISTCLPKAAILLAFLTSSTTLHREHGFCCCRRKRNFLGLMVLQKDGASAGVVEENEADEEVLVMSTSGWLRRSLTGMPIAIETESTRYREGRTPCGAQSCLGLRCRRSR